jgi:hypothetical protein
MKSACLVTLLPAERAGVPSFGRRAFPVLVGLKRIGRVQVRGERPGPLGDGSGQSQGIRSGEWHQMDLVMVFLALCLIAWMRGKLTPGRCPLASGPQCCFVSGA